MFIAISLAAHGCGGRDDAPSALDAAPAAAPAPWFGGSGGSTSVLGPCGSVAGLFGNAGSWLDGLGLVCAGEGYTQHVGGTGGQTFPVLSCPSGFVASGVFGQAGAEVNDLGLVCLDPATGAQRDVGPTPHGQAAAPFRYVCPSMSKLTALNVRSGIYVDALQPVCGPLTLPNPKPVLASLTETSDTNPIEVGHAVTIHYGLTVPWGCAARGSYTVGGRPGLLYGEAGSFTVTAAVTTVVTLRFWCAGYDSQGITQVLRISGTPAPVHVDSFTASPSYINLGDQATLSWSVSAPPTCGALKLVVQGVTESVFASGRVVTLTKTVSGHSSLAVKPDVDTSYTLTAQCQSSGQTTSATTPVAVYQAPKPGGNLSWYCFKVETPSAGCTEISYYMGSQDAAQQRATSEFDGSQVKSISCSQAATACQ